MVWGSPKGVLCFLSTRSSLAPCRARSAGSGVVASGRGGGGWEEPDNGGCRRAGTPVCVSSPSRKQKQGRLSCRPRSPDRGQAHARTAVAMI